MLGTIALLAAVVSAPASSASKPAAAGASSASTQADDTQQSHIIKLDPKRSNLIFVVHTTIGYATILKMPEGWVSTPVCGDCAFGDAKSEGDPLWRLDVEKATRTLTIKPILRPGVQKSGAFVPASAFATNIGVSLESGMTLSLTVDLVDHQARADATVTFTLPGDATGAARRTALERELEDQFADRVQQAAREKLLGAFMSGARCRDFAGRPNREDKLVVRLRQLCKMQGYLYITFEVENRGRSEALLQSASLSSNTVLSTLTKFERPLLRFNDRSLGVAAVELSDSLPPSNFSLTVVEDGGRARSVVIEGIEF